MQSTAEVGVDLQYTAARAMRIVEWLVLLAIAAWMMIAAISLADQLRPRVEEERPFFTQESFMLSCPTCDQFYESEAVCR